MITCRFKSGHSGPCDYVNAQGIYPRTFDQCTKERSPEQPTLEILLRASIELETLRKANRQLTDACTKAAPLLRAEAESLAAAALLAKNGRFSTLQEQADRMLEAAMLCELASKTVDTRVVDHLDGDARNNDLPNLRLMQMPGGVW